MGTTTKPLPDHGTQYRYKGASNGSWPGCRCADCTRAHVRACALRAIAHLAGQPPLYPGEPLREHIALLMNSGMSQSLIARRAQVAQATISYLRRGLTNGCQRDKALRILAVVPGDFDAIAECPATGTVRRVRALYAVKHGAEAIAAATSLDRATISNIANGRYRVVSGATRAAVAEAYTSLRSRPGVSAKAGYTAAAQGWHDPQFWDDIDRIDDPDFDPAAVTGDTPKYMRLGEDALWLREQGFTRQQVADRLGENVDYVDQMVKRYRAVLAEQAEADTTRTKAAA